MILNDVLSRSIRELNDGLMVLNDVLSRSIRELNDGLMILMMY